MQSVSSNAVAQALTEYQGKIKKYTTSISLTNSDLLNYGYKSKAISSDINNDNVVSIFFHTPTIAGSQGIQITPVYCGSGNLYFTYIKPTAISETVTYTIEIYYI